MDKFVKTLKLGDWLLEQEKTERIERENKDMKDLLDRIGKWYEDHPVKMPWGEDLEILLGTKEAK